MQETIDMDTNETLREKFRGEDLSDIYGQMNDRLMSLEPEGHTLVQRTFNQEPQNNSQRRREKRKAQKAARRANRR